MTTTTPTLDPTAAPLLDDRERTCEIVRTASRRRCHRVASWLLACDAADCGHWHGPVLACATCYVAIMSALAMVICPHEPCPLACYIRWTEPLR